MRRTTGTGLLRYSSGVITKMHSRDLSEFTGNIKFRIVQLSSKAGKRYCFIISLFDCLMIIIQDKKLSSQRLCCKTIHIVAFCEGVENIDITEIPIRTVPNKAESCTACSHDKGVVNILTGICSRRFQADWIRGKSAVFSPTCFRYTI